MEVYHPSPWYQEGPHLVFLRGAAQSGFAVVLFPTVRGHNKISSGSPRRCLLRRPFQRLAAPRLIPRHQILAETHQPRIQLAFRQERQPASHSRNASW